MRAAEALGLAWALGLAAGTALAFVLHLWAVPPSICLLAVPFGLVIAGAAVVPVVRPCARRPTLPVLLGAALCAVVVLHVAQLALDAPLAGWDAWAIWDFKARMLLAGGPPLAYFHDALTAWSHPDYPLNVPLAEAAALRYGGPSLAALIGPACFGALLLLTAGGLSRLYGPTVAVVGTLLLAGVPALSQIAVTGDADMPLTLYAGSATLYLLLWWRLRQPRDAVLLTMLCGAAVWTKKEGLLLAAVYLGAFAVGEWRRAGLRGRYLPVLAVLPLPLPWLIFSWIVRPRATDFLPVTPAIVVAHLDRLPTVLSAVAAQACAWGEWGPLWLLLGGFLLVRRVSPLLPVLLVQLAAVALPYVLSDWQPYTAHIAASLSRLVAHLVPLAVVALLDTVAGPRRTSRLPPPGCAAPAAAPGAPESPWAASPPATPPRPSVVRSGPPASRRYQRSAPGAPQPAHPGAGPGAPAARGPPRSAPVRPVAAPCSWPSHPH